MSVTISVCRDAFKINNVFFLPTKVVERNDHTIWTLEYSDGTIFIVDACTWDEISDVIKNTINDMHDENATLTRITSVSPFQNSNKVIISKERLDEIAKDFGFDTIYACNHGWYFGGNLHLANGDAWDGDSIYMVTFAIGLMWPLNVIVRALDISDAVDKAVDFLHAESSSVVFEVGKMKEKEAKEYEDSGYAIYGNHTPCYANVLRVKILVED